jgi:hypothetical protein
VGIAVGCAPGEGPLGVNEVASHVTDAALGTDDVGELADWLELLNDDAVERSLAGWTVTLDDAVFALPDLALAPGALALVWCDAEPDQGPLHAPFTLPESAFTLEVADAEGAVVQEISVPATAADQSFGRVPDDAPNWQVIATPSPAQRNGDGG